MSAAEQTIAYHRRGTVAALKLTGVVDIFEAKAFHAIALRALQETKAQTVRVNLADAQRIDISILQTLCALKNGLEAEGRTLSLESVPEAISESLQLLGLSL